MFLFLALACSGPAPEPASPDLPWRAPGDPGPYDPGVTTVVFTDPRGKSLTAEVWYPATADEGDAPDPYPEFPITLGAFRDAPAAPGPFPLVAFSHGHVAIRYQSAFLCEHLASHGFVVVSPDHPGDTLLDIRTQELWSIVLERPGDVIASVDTVLALAASGHPVLGGVTEAETYAMVGHSLGSLTALMLGGGEPDFERLLTFCDAAEPGTYEGCDRLVDLDPADAEGHVLGDARAVVTVPMSPGLWYAFGDPGLRDVRTPLVVAGGLDDILPYETEARPVYEDLGAPKVLATFPEAGHYGWSDICLLAPFWDECNGDADGYIDITTAQEITRDMVTAWIRAELIGDDAARDWLDGQIPGWPEVEWDDG